MNKIKKYKTINITYSKANFLTKEQVQESKYKYFVCIEEHEKLFREKEFWEREYNKLNERR